MEKLPILFRRAYPQGSPLAEITAAGITAHGHNVIVWFKTADNLRGFEIRGDARILGQLLKDLLARLNPPPQIKISKRLQATAPDWAWLTPEMVIDKFRQSEILRPLLPEVIAALKNHPLVDRPGGLAADLDRVRERCSGLIGPAGRPVWGAQSRVAEALGISNAGQANRERIKRVLEELAA